MLLGDWSCRAAQEASRSAGTAGARAGSQAGQVERLLSFAGDLDQPEAQPVTREFTKPMAWPGPQVDLLLQLPSAGNLLDPEQWR